MTMLVLINWRRSKLNGTSIRMILRVLKKVSHQLNLIKKTKMNSKSYLIKVFNIGTAEISSSLSICVRSLEGIAVIFIMIYRARLSPRFKPIPKFSGKTSLKSIIIKSTLIKLKKEKLKYRKGRVLIRL